MWIDERIVKKMPRTIKESTKHRQVGWLKRAARMALWEIREKLLKEHGEDIFNVFVYEDRVEVGIRGEVDTLERDMDGKKPYWGKRRER